MTAIVGLVVSVSESRISKVRWSKRGGIGVDDPGRVYRDENSVDGDLSTDVFRLGGVVFRDPGVLTAPEKEGLVDGVEMSVMEGLKVMID